MVFALGILLQIYFLGIPLGEPDPNPTLDTMLNPLFDTLSGFVVYAMRAAIPAILIALAVKFRF
ncbi:hypothetical protein WDJ50_02440 [Deinococcus sp. VB142]|uniref:Uncharacterized protein n=1 Tax=Deinococcus sp. VB142 TaxID=3112952 RepID=A0AAU6Q423_9DEIO